MARRGSALGYYDGNIVTEREYKRLNEDTGLRHTLQVQGGQWVNGLHGVTGMQFANTARGGNGQNNAKFGFDTDVVRVDATEVKRGQPVLINYKWPTAAWDEIESRIVGLCAWEGYDGGQGLGTEGGAFVDQLLVALRRGGVGAMMLRTVRRSRRATGGRVELQVHDENHEARRYYRRLGMRVTRWWESPTGPLRAEGESLYEPAKGCRIMQVDGAALDAELARRADKHGQPVGIEITEHTRSTSEWPDWKRRGC